MIKNSCYCGVMAMTDANLPFNQGFVEVVQTRFREGTIVSPKPGAAVSHYAPLAHLACDMVIKALGGFWPEKAAGSAGGGGSIRILGRASHSGKPWVLMELLNSALGGTSDRDGVSLIYGPLGAGQFRPGPIEIHETEFPLRVSRYDIRADSGGPGTFRGGMGSIREYEVLEEAVVPVRSLKGSLRTKLPPWGVRGGQSARIGNIFVNDVEVQTGTREIHLRPGDKVQLHTNAGGGYGDPLARDPELVLGDFLDGYISLKGAREDYGVVINPSQVDVELEPTLKLRAGASNTQR